jgi:uncharacterized damage-inducible protein DinB
MMINKMQINQHFLKQFEFENWSNTLILNSLKEINQPDDRALLLFSHLLSSHSMWLSRLTKTEMSCTLFQARTLDECEILMQQNLDGWKTFLAHKTNDDLSQTIEFMGAWEAIPQKRIMIIEDTLIHIINHSSYHRGQIVASIKGKIADLPQSTYIIYASKLV